MKRNMLRDRALALLLALVLALGMAPAALAADCSKGGDHKVEEWETIREATCHEEGVWRGVCTKCGDTVYRDIPKDKDNHDAVCTDNGDGRTHTATCRWCDDYRDKTEEHDDAFFGEKGRCGRCGALNYGSVKISLPKNPEVYVAVGDGEASISLGEVSLTLGSADVTDDYDLSYSWYYEGKSVGSSASYVLPDDFTEEEDDYAFVCFVMATPKNSLSSKPISASRTVTVLVRELVNAYAAVSGEDLYLSMDETNSRTGTSVYDQIYDAVYELSDGYPDYVIFSELPESKAGQLKAAAGQKYYFDGENNRKALEDLQFEPDKENTGVYVVNFTAYDTEDESYPGTLTIAVEQSLGELDVFYTAAKGEAVPLKSEDFEDFWLETYARGELLRVSFGTLPASSEGALYYDYVSASRPGSRVKKDASFFVDPDGKERALDGVTFVPDSRFTGSLKLPFEACGENNRGTQTYLSGSICIFVSDGRVDAIQYAAGEEAALDGADFRSVYQDATGTKPTNFYIQLLEVPAYGELYLNYTGGARDKELTEESVSDYSFHYSSQHGDEIGDLTYVPGRGGLVDTVRYVACNVRGEMLYIGTILFTRGGDMTVSYTAPASGVRFKSNDFKDLLGSEIGKDTYLSFAQPAAGTLYYSKSGSMSGAVKVAESDKYYLEYDLMGVDNLLFVPRTGQSGVVTLPFTVHDESGAELAGQVKITVQAASYTKSFTDVKKGDWFYTYVMDLAQAGVIDGMKPGVFDPNGVLSNGQALKMIMLATGYSEQAPTGKHWASGYLAKALTDGLLTKSVDLDRNISRYEIAELATRAMKLPKPSTTQSPFSDMAMNNASAPYVLALYEAGIVEGTTQSDGTVKYFGGSAIRRSEVATIIWRINNYEG